MHQLVRTVGADTATNTRDTRYDSRVRTTRRSDKAVSGMIKHAVDVSTCCPGMHYDGGRE
jgi:hypothetical protein